MELNGACYREIIYSRGLTWPDMTQKSLVYSWRMTSRVCVEAAATRAALFTYSPAYIMYIMYGGLNQIND